MIKHKYGSILCFSYNAIQVMNSKMKNHFTFAASIPAAVCILHTCFFFFPVAPSRQFTPVYVCLRTPNQPECVIKFNQPYAIFSMRFVVMQKMVFTMLHSSEGSLALYPTQQLGYKTLGTTPTYGKC